MATYSVNFKCLQEHQRVAVVPGNAHCMSIRQVSLCAEFADIEGFVAWPAAAAAALLLL